MKCIRLARGGLSFKSTVTVQPAYCLFRWFCITQSLPSLFQENAILFYDQSVWCQCVSILFIHRSVFCFFFSFRLIFLNSFRDSEPCISFKIFFLTHKLYIYIYISTNYIHFVLINIGHFCHVRITVWMHHKDFFVALVDKARWGLHKESAYCFEKIHPTKQYI